MSSGGGFSGGGGGYSGGFGPPMGGFGQPMGGFGGFGGGFGQPFGGGFGFQPPQYGGGFQQPQYGGGFGQPFGGFQQPQYGGGFGFQPPQFGGFQNQGPGNAYARQNPYQPPAPPQPPQSQTPQFGVLGGENGFRNFPQQPPPGMEQNPYYKPSNRYTDDMRISDMQYRPIQRANPATGVMPSEPISDPNYAPISEGLPARDQFSGPVMRPAVNPSYGSPYGGFGGPYGGSPYGGMFSGLGGFFGGMGGFQGIDQQYQQPRIQAQGEGLMWQQNQANQQAKLLAAQQGQQPSVETDAEFNQRIAQKESEYYADLERIFGKERADQIRQKHPVNFAAGSTRGATGNMGFIG